MTIHMSKPSLKLSHFAQGFDLVKSAPGWIAIRQVTEGHIFTFFFNSARTALASVSVTESVVGRYDPAYFEEAAWRYADMLARARGLIYARQVAA